MIGPNSAALSNWPLVFTEMARSGLYSVPVGRLTLARVIAVDRSSMPMSRAASSSGFASMRIARFCAPKRNTCATPFTIEMRWLIAVSAYSFSSDSGIVGEVSVRIRIEPSAGFTFWNEGGVGMSGGNCRCTREIAICTSCAAASMLRSSENCSVIDVLPSELDELMESMPGRLENCFSSGVATDAAIVSGLAPGRPAFTVIVGKSTVGKSLTGSVRYPMMPKITIDS